MMSPDLLKLYQKAFMALKAEHQKLVNVLDGKELGKEAEKTLVEQMLLVHETFKKGHHKDVKLALRMK